MTGLRQVNSCVKTQHQKLLYSNLIVWRVIVTYQKYTEILYIYINILYIAIGKRSAHMLTTGVQINHVKDIKNKIKTSEYWITFV